jgi:hypothetical protein
MATLGFHTKMSEENSTQKQGNAFYAAMVKKQEVTDSMMYPEKFFIIQSQCAIQ